MHKRIALVLVAATVALSGCATGSTFRSGVGDAELQGPPYYAGARAPISPPPRVVHLPIVYQAGATQPPSFDLQSDAGTPTGALLSDMNRYLDSLALTVSADVAPGSVRGTAPDVRFGCPRSPADTDCTERREADPDERRMTLAVGRPSASWTQWAAELAANKQASAVLVLTLETGQFWTRQRGRFGGRKSVELGTDYAQPVPWLTSLDAPVPVLQVTGALMDPSGRAIRIGAEGLLAKRTNIALSGLGVQAQLTNDDVERIRTTRRPDLPGQPLAWQVAIRNLVRELVGR